MNIEVIKQEYVPKYLANGDQRFYRFLLLWALNKLILIDKGIYKGTPPNLEYLDYYDRFIILYRREGDEVYLRIAKMLRKAAHKIYRIMLKKNMTAPNAKFLNLV
jgi:hypothetical protein